MPNRLQHLPYVEMTPMTSVAAPNEAAPGRKRPYARTFDQRRDRILAEAWKLIAERAGDDFSLTELSERADVATRTIYNAFNDRDGVVAQAMAVHYRSLFADTFVEKGEARRLAEALAMIDAVAEEIAKVPGWSRTGVMMYFSPRTNPKIVASLRAMPIVILNAWLCSDEADAGRVALLPRGDIERGFANAQWGLTGDWAAERIDVTDLARGMKVIMLQTALAFGNAVGLAAAEAEARRLKA